MTITIVSVLLAAMPAARIEAQCDWIELNRVMRPNGKVSLTQAIFWSLEADGDYHCRDWAICEQPASRVEGGWQLLLYRHQRHYRVIAPVFSESWTSNDPEVDDREVWPENQRQKILTRK